MNRADFLRDLDAEARSWLGTPFRANSATKGPHGGVCCHLLVAALYGRAGIDLGPVPKGPPGHARYNRESLMEPWIDACPHFRRRADTNVVEPGALTGYRIGHAIHHLAVVLPGNQIVHALDGIGVVITPLKDQTWASRLAAVWAPTITP